MWSALIVGGYSLVGLLFFGWSIWTAVAIYWVENAVRIPAMAVRIRRAFPRVSKAERDAYLEAREHERTNGVSEASRLRAVLAGQGLEAAGRAAGRRFLVFYGIFTAGHGIFVLMLGTFAGPAMAQEFGDPGSIASVGMDIGAVMLAAVVLVAVEALLLWMDREPTMPDVGGYTGRILVLHTTIVLGAFAVTVFDARALAILFVGLKTIADVASARRARPTMARVEAEA